MSSIKLQGQFRFDVFDANHNLLRSKDYVNNFITNSGVKYPYYFAFADCFRYLSLGSGTGANSILEASETTGLDIPLPEFAYIGRDHFVTGGVMGGGCGNRGNYSSNSISLFRQWALPDVTGGVFNADYEFKEFMVSPGRPPTTGWTREYGFDGENWRYIYSPSSSGLCTKNDGTIWAYSGDAPTWESELLTPADTSQTARYYENLPELQEVTTETPPVTFRTRPSICSAQNAFARVITDVNVASGEILTVTYKLNLSFSTGLTTRYFDNAGTEGNWSKMGIIGGITNPGVKLINDGTITTIYTAGDSNNVRLQHADFNDNNDYLYSFTKNYGESFIPTLGMPLEPSAIYGDKGNFIAYFTDDNTQFFANPNGGATNTGLYKPWNSMGTLLPQNSGVIPFKNVMSGSLVLSNYSKVANYWDFNVLNPRISGETNREYPETGDVTSSWEKPSKYFYAKFTNPRFSHNARTGEILTTYEFPGYSVNYPNTMLVKSFTVAYRDAELLENYTYTVYIGMDKTNKMAFYDSLISGVSGSSIFLPTYVTGSGDNSKPSTILNADSSDYNFLDSQQGSSYPQFTNKLTWIADCPAGVSGC